MTHEHQALIAETLQRAAARLGWLTRDLSIQAQVDGRDSPMTPAELAQGQLGQGLADIAAAAEGQPVDRAVLAETVQHVMETLFVPLWGDNFAIPDGFYSTPLGELISGAQLRMYDASDILTGLEAARMLHVSQPAVTQMLDDARLSYVVMHGQRRPLRSGVEAEIRRRQRQG